MKGGWCRFISWVPLSLWRLLLPWISVCSRCNDYNFRSNRYQADSYVELPIDRLVTMYGKKRREESEPSPRKDCRRCTGDDFVALSATPSCQGVR